MNHGRRRADGALVARAAQVRDCMMVRKEGEREKRWDSFWIYVKCFQSFSDVATSLFVYPPFFYSNCFKQHLFFRSCMIIDLLREKIDEEERCGENREMASLVQQ